MTSNGDAGESRQWVSDLWTLSRCRASCIFIAPPLELAQHGALPTLKVSRHSAMIGLHDGVVTFEQPSLRTGPPLKRCEFLTADRAQGAADSGAKEPEHS